MVRALFALVFFSGAAIAHPGHGALQVHWHMDDLALIALGVAAVVGVVYFLKKKQKR